MPDVVIEEYPRSFLASKAFWLGGLFSVAAWTMLYVLIIH